MAVSANTLFHFTSLNSLKGILTSQGFFCLYSDEHFENILPPKSNYRFTYIPMISFCDLTISQLYNDSEHRKNFGEYGIGLTKEWGIKNRVSPVMYVHKKSQPTKQLQELIKVLKGFSEGSTDYTSILEIEKELVDSFKYIKPYKGNWHKGKKNATIIYYNEREWRYCPLLKDHAVLSALLEGNKQFKDRTNIKLKENLIAFAPEDIKFIIIKNKSDVKEFVKVIRNDMKISIDQQNELLTKIITQKEIKEDYV